MKRILFILLSVILLQTTMCACKRTNAVNTEEIPILILDYNLNDAPSAPERADSASLNRKLTESEFYKFIRYDVIGKDEPIPKIMLEYTGFSTANDVYNQIINWIVPASERSEFDRTNEYDSDEISIKYAEGTGKGIAELTVIFKKRKDLKQCTVVFKPK